MPFNTTLWSLLAGAYLLLASALLAALRGDYSHVRHTLSELGETGAPRARLAAWGVFFPVGVALGCAALSARQSDVDVALLAFSLAIGYLGAALFPCDPGAPGWGSRRQQLHSAAGAIEYLGGTLALLRLADTRGPLFLLAAGAVACGAAGTALPITRCVRGLAQRVAELVLFTSLALATR